jgi:methionyl-tRNA formyltransferase
LIERVAAMAPDVMVANNWRTRLSEDLFTIPAHGTLNLLPQSLRPRRHGGLGVARGRHRTPTPTPTFADSG